MATSAFKASNAGLRQVIATDTVAGCSQPRTVFGTFACRSNEFATGIAVVGTPPRSGGAAATGTGLTASVTATAVDEGGETGKLIAWGPGPRASQSLMLAVRARALLDGRLAPSIDDVLDLAEPILKHRMALTFAARAEGETIGNVISKIKARIG